MTRFSDCLTINIRFINSKHQKFRNDDEDDKIYAQEEKEEVETGK